MGNFKTLRIKFKQPEFGSCILFEQRYDPALSPVMTENVHVSSQRFDQLCAYVNIDPHRGWVGYLDSDGDWIRITLDNELADLGKRMQMVPQSAPGNHHR